MFHYVYDTIVTILVFLAFTIFVVGFGYLIYLNDKGFNNYRMDCIQSGGTFIERHCIKNGVKIPS